MNKITLLLIYCRICLSPLTGFASEEAEFFESSIRPVLVKYCYECHSSASEVAKGDLLLDFRDGLRKGGESGPAVLPGKPAESLLLQALRHESIEMPPKMKLPESVISDFEKWISSGAVDPRDKASSPTAAAAAAWKAQLAERSKWWSLQPPKEFLPPDVDNEAWSKEPVDRFVLAALDQAMLSPAESANPETLLRRLSFVLTGLPPQPEQVQAFSVAYAENPEVVLADLVETLLESPHFGERFARHWMDVVRYTDTYGYEWDNPAKGSWEYRDYLIRAFNDDIGFDQLIREQIAGDLLPQPRINEQAGVNESIIAPMFYHLGEHRHGSSLAFNGIHQEMVNNKIDAFSKTFLAMTVGCARCHDHKLDAISQADYYALAGVFMTPRWTPRVIDAPGKNNAAIMELIKLRDQIRKRLGKKWGANSGPLASGLAFQKWAHENRNSFQDAKIDDLAWPLSQLLSLPVFLKSTHLMSETTDKSTELIAGQDGVILAKGDTAASDSYKVKFTTEPGNASFLRLEALTHAGLGPGRTPHGNFVLTHLKVEVQPFSASDKQATAIREVPLNSARADYSQPGYPVAAALDPATNTGWGVGLGGNVDRMAWFHFAEPVSLPHGGEWTVTLEQRYGSNHLLGRFRLMLGNTETTSLSDRSIAKDWLKMKSEWTTTRELRLKSNTLQHTVLSDFRTPGFPEGWSVEGDGITHGYVADGAPLISLTGETLIDRLLPRGYHTHALSSKLAGALRLPDQEVLPGRYVSMKVHGGEWAGYLSIPQNAFQNEGPVFFDSKASHRWVTLGDQDLKIGVTRVFTELMTASLNPNFPPRTGVARSGSVVLPNQDDGFNKRSWFSLTGIVTHEAGVAPQDTLEHYNSLFEGLPPETSHGAWQQIVTWFTGAVDRWASNDATAGDVVLINWLLTQNLLLNQTSEAPEIASLVNQYRIVEERIAFPRSAMSMDEREVSSLNYRLNVRGDVNEEGPEIPRNFLDVFSENHRVAESQRSGRLELAEYLSSPENPLTARVYVNRVWQSIFGTGIVSTPSDFGKLGDRPSHPELLDWLTIQFMNEGWSTKKLIRRLVLSQTFRQSSGVSKTALDRDPNNRLLHHYPTRRLEAEAIRDNLLAVAGRLDPQFFGPPINPPRQTEDPSKRLFSGPLDSGGRRSLYMKMSIMDPPKFLVCFNLPDLKLPTGRRDVTNGPAHALALLNNPLVIQLSVHWAKSLINDGKSNPDDRVQAMFIQALGRIPSDMELHRWTNAVQSFSQSGEIMKDNAAWTELAHLFFNTKEFIYYR